MQVFYFNLVRLPPALSGSCEVQIRGKRATAKAVADLQPSFRYIYHQDDSVVIVCDVIGWPAPE